MNDVPLAAEDLPEDLTVKISVDTKTGLNKMIRHLSGTPPVRCGRVDCVGDGGPCDQAAIFAGGAGMQFSDLKQGAWDSIVATAELSKDVLTSVFGGKTVAEAADILIKYLDSDDYEDFLTEMGEYGVGKVGSQVVKRNWGDDYFGKKIGSKLAKYVYDDLFEETSSDWQDAEYDLTNCGTVHVTQMLQPLSSGSLRLTIGAYGNCQCSLWGGVPLGEFHLLGGVDLVPQVSQKDGTIQILFKPDNNPDYRAEGKCCTGGSSGDDDGSGTHLEDDEIDAYGLGEGTSTTTGAGSFTVSVDNAETCDYGGSTVVVDGGDPSTTDGGDDGEDGGSTPPGPTPTGLRPPGGAPTIVVSTPGGTPDDEDEPTSTAPPDEPTTTPDDDEPEEDEPTTPPPTVYVGKVTKTAIESGRTVTTAAAGALLQLGPVEDSALPVAENAGSRDAESGHADPPTKVMTDENGEFEIAMGGGNPSSDDEPRTVVIQADASAMDGAIQKVGSKGCGGLESTLRDDVRPHLASCVDAPNGESYAVYRYPDGTKVNGVPIEDLLEDSEYEPCGTIAPQPTNDPFVSSDGSWGQDYADQWAIQRVGYTTGADSAWHVLDEPLEPVVVAVVDTGLDWNHLDLSWESIWRNPGEIAGNGVDDDANGYVDDLVGWDFFDGDNHPWDTNGHGTFVTGLIAATRDNGTGITGIAPNARIMILRALDAFGHTRAAKVAESIFYAADNGARIVNVSVESPALTRMEQEAVDYARSRGTLVVVAAGNEAIEARGPARLEGALVVTATDLDDARAPFSNWGSEIDIAAPGVDVLSLRARRTDFSYLMPGVEYELGMGWVGADHRYYRSAGTSFAAPIVSGTAALLLGARPELTVEQVERILLQSAEDVDIPGKDRHTGYGLLDARAALVADPSFFVEAEIDAVSVVVRDGAQLIQVVGTADADRFARAWLELGPGEHPSDWRPVGAPLASAVRGGLLGEIPARELAGAAHWMLRIVVQHDDGRWREGWFEIDLE